MPRFSGQGGIASLANRRVLDRLRDALAALPQPWIVLANRRRSGADGPPWVRYIVLHPSKGIALVDLDPTELAVAPLEDFFVHTGLAALQSGALPIVAATMPMNETADVADLLETTFLGSRCQITNPNWCEAVVDLLLATPELMLMQLPRASAKAAQPQPEFPLPASFDAAPEPPLVPLQRVAAAVGDMTPASQTEEPALLASGFDAPSAPREAASSDEHWLLGPQAMPPRATWRSWPTSPVTVAVALLALGAVVLVSWQASPPTREQAAHSAPVKVASTVAAPAKAMQPATAIASAQLPPAADTRSQTAPTPASGASAVTAPVAAPLPLNRVPARPPKRPVVRRQPVEHYVRPPVQSAPPPPPQLASAAVAPPAACADVLHPDLPGGWQYRGPPVPGCLPIRFFGFVGMR